MEEQMKDCYWYGRNSTDMQDDSRYQQYETCKKYAKKRGYNIVKEFYDDAYSGTNTKRPAFQQMMNDLEKSEIHYILTYSSDRISRNLNDSVKFLDELEAMGCCLISVTQPNFSDGTAEGKLFRNISLSVGQYHVDNTVRLVKRSMYSMAERSIFTGGVPPYGLKIVDKKYVINEEESPAVQLIFEMIVKNCTYEEISNKLNEKGYRRRNGEPFSKKTIFIDMIKNERYKGWFIYGKTFKNKRGQYNQHKNRPISEQVINKGAIPAIVSEELWDKANKLVSSRRHRGGSFTSKEYYILSNKIECSCGHKMYGNRRYSGGGKYQHISYRCSSHERKQDSNCKEIKRDMIEGYILKNLNYYFNDKTALKVLEYVANYTLNKYFVNSTQDVKSAKIRLKSVEKKLENLLNSLSKTSNELAVTSILERIQTLEYEKENVLDEINTFEKQANIDVTISEENIRQQLHKMFVEVVGESDRRKLSGIIDKCVDSVVVDKDRVQINYDLDFIFVGMNKLARMSVVALRTELNKEITTLWYQVSDIGRGEIKIDYKIKKQKEKRHLIFQNGVHKEVVSL